ncbi:MAG: hypothetical protein GX112_02430 [Clostridiaceae bacterium]|nr:hypothetical protein [Clostridiaceae bacterium]
MTQKTARRNPNRFSSREKAGLLILLAVLVLLLIVFYAFSGHGLLPDDMAVIPTTTGSQTTEPPEPTETVKPVVASPVLISEIVSSNRSILQTADQQTPDWIELWNISSAPVNLAGYGLSDNLNRPMDWVFPAVTLSPGSRLVVYASGLSGKEADDAFAGGEIHAAFRLAQAGEDLIFSDPAGNVLARLAVPAIPTDVSWGLKDSAAGNTDPYYFFAEPTPHGPNGQDGHVLAEDAIRVPDCPLIVNEYVTAQDKLPDPAGLYPDWVELYNTGSEPFPLLGCTLSDDPDQLDRWSFPDLTVGPGEYLVVWLSGEQTAYIPGQPATLAASFRLGDNDSRLLLADARGRLLLTQEVEALPANVSRGRSLADPDSWFFFPTPTPGRANDTQGFADLPGALQLKNRGVWINEVIALQATVTRGSKAAKADWIELFNGLDEPVDLTGYGLSDDPKSPFLETLSGLVIEPGGYALVEPAAFGISGSGETLQLTDPDGVWVDRFTTGALANQVSSGRGNTDGAEPADSRFFYRQPTPGRANSGQAATGIAMTPALTAVSQNDQTPLSGLYLDGPALVTLSSPQPGAAIHYTLDGSPPTAASHRYTEPLRVDQTTVIRCMATLDGSLDSPDLVRTFLAGERHTLPVVSIVGRPDDFFDAADGLWANYQADIEREATIDFYEADGTRGVGFSAGIALHGSYSRTEKQKSLELKVRTMYGDSQVTYPFFPGNPVQTFKRLVLRTSGQDWRFTKLRDAFMTEVIADYTAQDTMDHRAIIVYINGEYFGLYNLREKVDQYYMASHHGTDPDQVDIIKGNRIILNGDYDAYGKLLSYVKNHDMRDDEAYAYVLSQIDEHSLMDFVITQTFFNNLDSGNKKFWRARADGAEWRWVFFDLDWAMFPTTYQKNILKYDLLDPNGHGQQDIFDATLQVKLMQNPDFREAFIARYAWYLNEVFETDRMLAILDEMTETIRPEMPRQIARWGGPSSLAYWENQVKELRRITSEKRGRVIQILQETFNLPASQMKALFPGDFS